MLGSVMVAGAFGLATVVSGLPVEEAPSSKLAVAGKRKAPGSMPVSFVVGFKRPEEAAADALRQVSDPASANYRSFPDRSQIARTYGATPASIEAVRVSAARAGLDMDVDRTGVFARISGPAKKMTNWLGRPVMLRSGVWRGLQVDQLTSKGPAPAALRGDIKEFVGFDIRVARRNSASALAYSGRNTGRPRSCLPSKSPEMSKFIYSYNQLRTAYGVDTLPAGPAIGRKTRVTILGQGDGFSRKALRASAFCFGLPEMDFDRVGVAGLRAPLPVGDEGNLDVQVVQAVLPPRSHITVVESASFDQREFLPFATAYSRKHLPHVVTTSYGYCEPDAKRLPKGVLGLTESVLLRLSLAGTTVFAASGDRGSSDCINNLTGKGPKRISVDYPASSPHVMAIGGTRITLNRSNRRVDEVVWNATKLDRPIGPEKLAGGGGRSVLFPRPWWQTGVNSSVRRAVPDISAHSAGGPAWPLIYQPDAVAAVGGTSAAAPFVAATVGLLAAQQDKGFGLLQPTVYALPRAAFFDIVSGSNDLFKRGCCKAQVGYDLASGLGSPRFDRWAQDLPGSP